MNLFLPASFVSGIIDWIAVGLKQRRLEYVAKPATLVFLILWFVGKADLSNSSRVAFLIGLIFSLAGDVFLMLPKDRFLAGLASFFVAQVAYIVAFNPGGPILSPYTLGAALVIAAIALVFLWQVRRGLARSGSRIPFAAIVVYAVVLSLTLWSTWIYPQRFPVLTLLGRLIPLGGLLFFVSDAVLAWNRFVGAFRAGRLINMSTYHLAQWLLALGIASVI
jgi:uncharacterized membrane protein YhhN